MVTVTHVEEISKKQLSHRCLMFNDSAIVGIIVQLLHIIADATCDSDRV